MAEIIGVRFKAVGKVYFFDPAGQVFSEGDQVIVETARGVECGFVAQPNQEVEEEQVVHPLKPILRRATEADLCQVQRNRGREKQPLISA